MRVLIIAKHLPISVDAASERVEPLPASVDGTAHRRKLETHRVSYSADSSSNASERIGRERFANEVLWPLFHYASRDVRLDACEEWAAYRRVNESFAAAIVDHHRPGDVVVVCDYQLALVPALLRTLKSGIKIGFFLHTPFPSPEVFRLLPWREELLRGLLGADLIGFHGQTSAEHFKLSLLDVLGVEPSSHEFVEAGRVVRFGVYPVGIDAGECERQARAPDIEHEVTRLRELAEGKPIVLSVVRGDSMRDSSNCVVQRVLSRAPNLADRVHFVEIVAPSSGDPSSGTRPSARELCCLYRAADVALISAFGHETSLAEKEYVASRIYESGVLIVPEFSDSARELREALRINPYDIDATVGALERALEMDRVEQRFRMRSLRARVVRNDARRWARQLIADLLGRPCTPASGEPEELLLKQLTELRYAQRLSLFLAYDGTLVPFAPLPELAAPDPEVCRLLEQLAKRKHLRVHLVSGRPRGELEAWFGELPIALHAEHGYWSRLGPGQAWIAAELGAQDWKSGVTSIFTELTECTAGSRLEAKTASVAWHYRSADPDMVIRRLKEARSRIARVTGRADVELVDGAKVLEVRRRGIHGGRVATSVLAREGKSHVVAAGGDTINEELFAAVPPVAVTIHVGSGPTQAAYQVSNPERLRSALRVLVADRRAS